MVVVVVCVCDRCGVIVACGAVIITVPTWHASCPPRTSDMQASTFSFSPAGSPTHPGQPGV